MKNILIVLFLSLILLNTSAKAGRTALIQGKMYEGTIFWKNKMKFELPPGQWILVEKYGWNVSVIYGKGVSFAKINGNTLDEVFEFEELNGGGKWMTHVVQHLYQIMFKGEHDGCYQRPEYYLHMVKKSGGFFNCFNVRHVDTEKLLFSPDDKRRKVATAIIRKWIRENDIEVPKMMLGRSHAFFAPSIKDSFFGEYYFFNPETKGGPKNKFLTENSSEYHRSNISNYPKFKKYMDDFVNNAAYEHKKFEKIVKAKSRHIINFDEFNIKEPIEEIKTTTSSPDLTEEIQELYDLYKMGALTKEEFEKAKAKILN